MDPVNDSVVADENHFRMASIVMLRQMRSPHDDSQSAALLTQLHDQHCSMMTEHHIEVIFDKINSTCV